ncbi:transmembrane protein 45B-like isoform X1 [Biomphalaria glabrata]|uniref:Transmembrane protein 45B-like isoform X1 n=2 Tax=Biomphalaria glabrata TaxID=6526 RepID=A0A9W2YEZ1_BIOGL|nr:transmembrane protein 45B-like isoform X1 [Biomphalaria glabrata]
MSTFWGYLLEGSVFTMIWIWWLINTFVGAIRCQSEGKEFIPRLSYPLPGTKMPVEIVFKLAVSGVGFLATIFYDGLSLVDESGNYRKMAVVLSMSIYGIFMVHSLLELLLWYGVPLIRNSDYVTGALGFMWYSLATFYRAQDFGHHGQVASMVKTFPLYPLFAIGVSLLVEAGSRRGYWTQMIRIICLGLLATWDWNAAFILHKASPFPGAGMSSWDMSDHDNAAFIGAAFGDHICFHLMFLIVAYLATAVFMRFRYGVSIRYQCD